MGSGASIQLDSAKSDVKQEAPPPKEEKIPSPITSPSLNSSSTKVKRNSIISLLPFTNSNNNNKEEDTAVEPFDPKKSHELERDKSERFSIFEEPVNEVDVVEVKDERAARRLSRNIVSGEILGNLLQAQFSMKAPASTIQHNEYLLQKAPSSEPEGDKLQAKSLADLRKNMRDKLTNELSPQHQNPPPVRAVSCVDGLLPNLQELKHKRRSLDAFTSLPNLQPPNLQSQNISSSNLLPPMPPIGKSFTPLPSNKMTAANS